MDTKAPCEYFSKGHCIRGEECYFAHEKTTIAPRNSGSSKRPIGAASQHSGQDPRSQTPCYHHARGDCRSGNKCPYSHTAEKGQKSEPDLDLELEGKPNRDSFKREFGGALVQFDVGARVSKVSLPEEFSAVRIDGLPMDSTSEHIASLLSKEGIQVIPSCVRIRQPDGASYASADIKVDDPTFAKRLCTKLAGRSRLKTRYPNVEAFQVSAGLPSGTNVHRTEHRKVQCSWFKPSKSAWLNFDREKIAKRVSTKFNSGSYKVLSQTLKCEPPTKGEGGQNDPLAWTLELARLPVMTTKKNILSAITSRYDKPSNIELGSPSYSADGEEAGATVSTEIEGTKRAKAVARFYEKSDARTAVNTLHDTPLPFCEDIFLTVQLVSTAKFKVASIIFNAVQSRIRTASQDWDQQYLKFKIYPTAGLRKQYRILKIEGEESEDVAFAKETLNEILEGVTVMSEGKPLWTPSLVSNGAIFQRLKIIQGEQGVIILRNRKKQELKLYGSGERCKEVELIITYMINTESHDIHIIELKPENFRWVCSGGFKMITAALGQNVATFDIVSRPKRILVGGTEKQYEIALRMINKKISRQISKKVTADEGYVVFWGPAENPLVTKCNHKYCTECFELSCNAASSSEKDFSTNCHGDTENCNAIFSLEELQETSPTSVSLLSKAKLQ
ncbi:hypothetical protein EYC80_005783 [Monilinia laxa]|uniref:C3H1-type domain-containing protein n=1 Tax=Monilinia laxa TaxID=61186 RepID=A0A5N6KF29_MONLA|nr:hypothetical protein EYC80_005783 [Monilinia laxa]